MDIFPHEGMEATRTHLEPGSTFGASAGDPRDPGPIPNYELIEIIGAGGFGEVWLARERVTEVRRAVKVLYKANPTRTRRDIAGVKRYQQCSHDHPTMLQILTVGETERCFYYVMELADRDQASSDGHYQPTTLRQWMERRGRSDGRTALELVAKLVAGVRQLHEQGLAHYDLKPENVLIVNGEPKLADVGLVAPLDQPAPSAGTSGYLSPGGHADDLYAIGKILYELISARPARDFPSLPPELTADRSHAVASAVEIANRACDPRRGHRFPRVIDIENRLQAALRQRDTRWRTLPRPARLAIVTGSALSVLASVAIAPWVYGLFIPVSTYTQQIDLRADDVFKLRKLHAAQGETYYPFLRFGGREPPDSAGEYSHTLHEPLQNFLVDFHLRFGRPWGQLELSLADASRRHVVKVQFRGQSDGLGLRTEFSLTSASLADPHWAEPVLGHPQSGVEYLARLLRCRDTLVLALWPLAYPSKTPILRSIDLPPNMPPVQAITVKCLSVDPRAEVELLALRVTSLSSAPERADGFLPQAVRNGPRPGYVPELADTTAAPQGNLLADPFHPYDSGAWLSLGNWSWWSGDAPAAKPKEIRCVPFSSAERDHRRAPDTYEGLQILRFDRAAYRDFEARVVVKLADPADSTHDPFVTRSHAGTVGLAFRMQDEAPAGFAWGGGYIAGISLHPDEAVATTGGIARRDAFGLRYSDLVPAPGLMPRFPVVAYNADIGAREELFAPEGFTLTLRARGAHFELLLNDRLILEGEDTNEAPLGRGRIALYASRLIATFESLHVTPLVGP